MESENHGPETAGEQFSTSEKQDPNQSVQLTTQEVLTARSQKSGGPKTQQGRQRSSQNSLKHGLFSAGALRKGESRAKLNSLLTGLRNDLEPEGELEELLVDKLAALAWLQRRVIIMVGEQTQGGFEASLLRDNAHGGQPLELLLRYQTNLDREFDRGLSQLERLQRSRKGQPEPPTLNLNVST
jgi:hypothetical protein